MCGIVGSLNLAEAPPPKEALLRNMLAQIRHRGPDEFGIFLDDILSPIGSPMLEPVVESSSAAVLTMNPTGVQW